MDRGQIPLLFDRLARLAGWLAVMLAVLAESPRMSPWAHGMAVCGITKDIPTRRTGLTTLPSLQSIFNDFLRFLT